MNLTQRCLLDMSQETTRIAQDTMFSKVLNEMFRLDQQLPELDASKYYSDQNLIQSSFLHPISITESSVTLPMTQQSYIQPTSTQDLTSDLPYEKSFVCLVPSCGKVYRSKSSFRKHMDTHTDEEKALITGKTDGRRKKRVDMECESFICKYNGCNKIFQTKHVLLKGFCEYRD